MGAMKAEDQLALDETVHEDPELEAALEEREKRKASLGAVRKLYQASDEIAKSHLSRLELEDGDAARVGRFRITKTAIEARVVSFETKASSRIRIGLVGEDDAEASTVAADDDTDVRPTGDVNADALRGEVERATLPEPTVLRPGGKSAGRNAARGPLPPVN